MTSEQILKRYERGETTTDLVLDILSQSEQSVVSETLEKLAPELVRELEKFVRYYKPSVLVFRGPEPKMQTIQFVKTWLEQHSAAKSRRPPYNSAHAKVRSGVRLKRTVP